MAASLLCLLIRPSRNLLICALLAAAAPAVEAATLGELLKRLDNNPEHDNPGYDNPGHGAPQTKARCLEAGVSDAPSSAAPLSLPPDACAARAVSGLYLGLLRDRERLRIVRAAITRQQRLLPLVEKRITDGRTPQDAFLLADNELNRWRSEETRLAAAVLHAELFFRSLEDGGEEGQPSDLPELQRPRFSPSAWPADESAALAALAQDESVPEDQRRLLRTLLQHAWIDYKAAERRLALLRPMSAAAQDIARVARERYSRTSAGDPEATSLAALQERHREASGLRVAVVDAEYTLMAAQLQVLELLGRSGAVE